MVVQETVRLLLAARNGDRSILDSAKITESIEDDHGANCLHYAARGGDLSVIEYLVKYKGLNPMKRSNVGATALHDAAATGNLEALKWLLEQVDAKVDDQDGTGATVTHLSARYGHTQLLEWLLDETNCDVLKKSASGALPLHFAAEGGHLECVKILVDETPRSVNMQMNNGCTSVYLACQHGHLATAQFLASKNGTPKIHTFDGMSPLHASAQTGHLHIVKWLIGDQGLNPNERDFDGATPLHYAASQAHDNIVDWLLTEGGARIVLDNLGGSPLHTAAEFGINKVVRTLLGNGCDSDITDNEGLTAAELADKCGHLHTAALLRGEDVHEPAEPQRLSPTPAPSSSQTDTSVKRTPPAPLPKPASPVAVKASLPASSKGVGRAVIDSLENLETRRGAEVFTRSTSVVSVASSASSFGYFSPSGGGITEEVKADVHESPFTSCVFNSKETGEREIAQCSGKDTEHVSSSRVTPEDISKAKASAAVYLSASADYATSSATSRLPPVKPSFVPVPQNPAVSRVDSGSVSNHSNTSVRETRGSEQGRSEAVKRDASPSVAERKAWLQAAASQRTNNWTSPRSAMEEVKVNGEVARSNETLSSTSSGGSAKSVIKISNKSVTIISTGKDGTTSPKVSTSPLRNSDEVSVPSSQVSSGKPDSGFIQSLTQKFQANGPSPHVFRPLPTASVYRGSNSQSGSEGGASETKPWQQRRQQTSDTVAAPPPPPPPVVNGHGEGSSATQMNGFMEEKRVGVVPPPPPAPPAAPQVRKADASYTPRAKPAPYQNGSLPHSPRGGEVDPIQQTKGDLMAALTAVVTSGSPSASLRKTRGPGKGGVNEVFASKSATQKQPTALPPIEEFSPKNFMDQVPDTDSSGNKIPDWKRQMKAKNLAQKAQQEYMEKKQVEDYEARFKNMPAWKRALIEKKEAAAK